MFKIFSVSGIDMRYLALASSSFPVAKKDEKEDMRCLKTNRKCKLIGRLFKEVTTIKGGLTKTLTFVLICQTQKQNVWSEDTVFLEQLFSFL